MDFLLAFFSGFVSTLGFGVVAMIVGGLFASKRSARVTGFAVSLGYAVGRYSFSGEPNREAAVAATAAFGAAAAVVLLWYVLLKRSQAHPTDE